jgi:hypothetical protein
MRGGVIRADLIGSTTCSAVGIIANSPTPVQALCRRLVAAGHDPATPMHVYRGATLALTVRSIGEAAGLEIGGDGTSFRPRRKPDAASPVRKSEPVGTGVWIEWPPAMVEAVS